MNDPLTTLTLIALTAMTIAASVLAIRRLSRQRPGPGLPQAQHILMTLATIGSAALLAYRAIFIHQGWQLLQAHVDGLLLIAVLLMLMLGFLQTKKRLESLAAFSLPLVSLMLAWAICASAWTFEPFPLDSVWAAVHRIGVYLGGMFYLVAASAGLMFLVVRRRLRRKNRLATLDRMPSLEAIEAIIIHTATLGFALLTLGLITGLIIVASGPTRLGAGWWYSPKVILGCSAWLIYALVMNVRFGSTFRGPRAAWISIIGLLLVLATFAVAVSSLPGNSSVHEVSPGPSTQNTTGGTH